METPSDDKVKSRLGNLAFAKLNTKKHDVWLDDDNFNTIKIHLMAVRLVSIDHLQSTTGKMLLFWFLTKKGEHLMMDLRSVKVKKDSK